MGRRRKRARQEGLWTPTEALPVGASHPFYERLNQILDEKKFDEYVENICERFYAGEAGQPGLAPNSWRSWIVSGRRKALTRFGRIRTIPTRGSPR